MKLIALILGLALEHFATQLLHLRELRWFDGYFDFVFRETRNVAPLAAGVIVVCALVLPLIPVLWASVALRGDSIPWDLAYLAFAVLIVFFCLGPRDLGNEVDEYCGALERGDQETAERVLVELSETGRAGAHEVEVVEEAVFVQATNRIFGVIFWFIALGPVGAWLFRLSDLMRRRAAFEAGRDGAADTALPAIEGVHGVLVWIPARLALIGYALGGSFDEAFNRWRSYEPEIDEPFYRSNDRIVACVGRAAMSGVLAQPANSAAAARNAMRLVTRTVFIWLTVIALMTLFGWAV